MSLSMIHNLLPGDIVSVDYERNEFGKKVQRKLSGIVEENFLERQILAIHDIRHPCGKICKICHSDILEVEFL